MNESYFLTPPETSRFFRRVLNKLLFYLTFFYIWSWRWQWPNCYQTVECHTMQCAVAQCHRLEQSSVRPSGAPRSEARENPAQGGSCRAATVEDISVGHNQSIQTWSMVVQGEVGWWWWCIAGDQVSWGGQCDHYTPSQCHWLCLHTDCAMLPPYTHNNQLSIPCFRCQANFLWTIHILISLTLQ